MDYLLAIDQGTSSSRAVVYDETMRPVAEARRDISQMYPAPGLVEHDAMEIWDSVVECVREAVQKSGIPARQIRSAGIANQRETVVVWERETGLPVHRAIVWQDRRTAEFIEALREGARDVVIQQRTGLFLDPYFSASKLRWILRAVNDGQRRAGNGELLAGTIDSWLVYRLTGGALHITDVSNASRTMLMNLHSGQWDPELCSLFGIPMAALPRIVPTSGLLGEIAPDVLGVPIPICAAVGDQQSALFGQLCTEPGLLKCTYGTGCFLLEFTGPDAVLSSNRLLTTVAWKLGGEPMQYALEGSVFIGGAAVQWLRDGLGIIGHAAEIDGLARQVPDSGGVVLVPAFTGLGAPHWEPSARGAILGISRGTNIGHIARATLEGISHQVADVIDAMRRDSGRTIPMLRVDGGASASDLLMQTQSDLLGIPVERPADIESTARGAAMLAGLGVGMWPAVAALSELRESERTFSPSITAKERKERGRIWSRAVRCSKNYR